MKKLIMGKLSALILTLVLLGCISVFAQTNNWTNLENIKAGKYDTGKMWTFEYPPLKYFESEYNFNPTQEWLNNVRMSALRFANYCSASFVSADGLVMTNHHCGRRSIVQVSKEDEDLMNNGFFAKTLADERPVPGLYVDQLVLIKDVTSEVQEAIDQGKTAEEKAKLKNDVFKKITAREDEESGLRTSITTLFNGGKYSLYGYKRYNDVRLVFAPEEKIAYFGGDPDNFTYPRYDLDCSFFRVYDEAGKPLKTEHYFHWSPNGSVPGEPVFVVGNPGRTNRLKTIAQLEYMRDIQYPRTLDLLNGLMDVYSQIMKKHPERTAKLQNSYFGFSNSQKAYTGMLKGLRNPILMQKKIDFENNFKKAIQSDDELNKIFGNLWGKIENTRKEISKISNENYGLRLFKLTNSEYFVVAQALIDLANELKLPEDKRSEEYKGEELNKTIESIFPKDFDYEMNDLLLLNQIKTWHDYLGANYPLYQKMTDGKTGKDALKYILDRSSITNSEKVAELIDDGPDDILNSDDPFIYFIMHSKARYDELSEKIEKITEEEDTYAELLGRALFNVYGTSIPPDATFTLRLADGVVDGFPYNGTKAPPYTTMYGAFDRYNSFGKNDPWELPKSWLNAEKEINLATPFNFVSTNDIIGGNSGSPVINKNSQVVGLAFDGNIQSLPGNFIFTTEQNRTVSVDSRGLYEAIKNIYKATRLSDELKNGKIVK